MWPCGTALGSINMVYMVGRRGGGQMSVVPVSPAHGGGLLKAASVPEGK